MRWVGVGGRAPSRFTPRILAGFSASYGPLGVGGDSGNRVFGSGEPRSNLY